MSATAASNNAYIGSVGVGTVDRKRLEMVTDRLIDLRDRLSNNALRMTEFGSRACGSSPVGTDKAQNSPQPPRPAGALSAIDCILDEIGEIARLQNEAINFADRIV